MAREATVEIAYIPFKTFLTALETLAQGVPDPVDRSVFRNQSFSTQAMIISALKALGAIDGAGHPQPVLARLINTDTRAATLKEVLEERYSEVLALGPAATDKQFDDCFAAYGVSGDTRKKAKSFFLQAAHMAKIPLSPHVPGVRSIADDSGEAKTVVTRRRRGQKRRERLPDTPDDGGGANTSGSSKTIKLVSGGGEVTLKVSIDPMELETDDRVFVFDLIDKLKKYEKDGGPPQASR